MKRRDLRTHASAGLMQIPSAMTPHTAAAPAPSAHAHRGCLYRKYLLLIMMLVGLALLASGAISLYLSWPETTAAPASLQREKAVGAAARIEVFE